MALAQCVETERALRRQQHGGSRASLASLGAIEKGDDVSSIYKIYETVSRSLSQDRGLSPYIQTLLFSSNGAFSNRNNAKLSKNYLTSAKFCQYCFSSAIE